MSDEIQTTDIAPHAIPFVLAEYTNLRAEIIKLVELEHQIASGSLLAVGAFLTIGLQPGKPASILLVYPLLAAFLALGWAHKDMRIRQIAAYICIIESKTLEGEPLGLGWGNFLKNDRTQVGIRRTLGLLSASGVFVVTQIFTVLLACSIGIQAPVEWMLLLVDALCILMTIAVLASSPGWKKVLSR